MRVEKNGEIDSIEEVSNKDLEIKKPIVKVQEADNIHSVNSILSNIIKKIIIFVLIKPLLKHLNCEGRVPKK